jgi:FkbM family methyltransferase
LSTLGASSNLHVVAIYADRYRFAMEPARLAALQRSMLADLVNDASEKWRVLQTLLPDRRAIKAAHDVFEDRESRITFRALLLYRYLTPHLSRIARDRARADALEAFMQQDRPFKAYQRVPPFLGEPLGWWAVTYNDVPVEVATIKYGLYWTAVSDQYFLRRSGTYAGPSPGDVVLDCGSCLGDTAVKFAAHVGASGRVYGFDPSPQHVAIAREVAAHNRLSDRVTFYCSGVAARTYPDIATALTSNRSADATAIQPGRRLEISDSTVTIDDFCRHERLTRIDFIKMDIEGSEAAALEGAGETIERWRPKLAICVYHKPSDVWTIPNEVRRRYPFYRLFLGHYSLHLEETVMYAIDDRSSRFQALPANSLVTV